MKNLIQIEPEEVKRLKSGETMNFRTASGEILSICFERIYKRHAESNGNGEKEKIPCEYCDKVHSNKVMHYLHLSKTHADKAKYGCKGCAKKFHSPTGLRVHQKITGHGGKK